MNLKQLEYFVHVAELGSFSKAALVLQIAQPALSRQVRALEMDLRETLLLRNGRGVALTEAGRRLFEHSVGILQLVAQAREELGARRDEPAGHITIGLPPSIARQLTLPLIDGFQQDLPKARLAIVEGLSTHVAEWIATGRVDVGLLHNPESQASLEITPVLEEPLCLVEPITPKAPRAGTRRAAGHATEGTVPLREIGRYPLVMPERTQAIRRLLESQAVLAGVRLNIAWEVSSIPSIIDLVCAGYGCGVLTASAVAASSRAGELRVRPLTQPQLVSVLCVAVSTHKRSTPLIRQAQAMLQALTRALPQGTGAR